MDEATRTARYEAQRGGGSETPRQRRRRLHKRGHQMRAKTLRMLRPPVDLGLPDYPNLVFRPYKIMHTGSRGAVKIAPAEQDET
jgi:hypothetical protein